MNVLTVTRKNKIAGALMPYWIITCMSKADLCSRYGLTGDKCGQSESGFPIPRIDMNVLDEIGTRIHNGETVDLELKEGEVSMFVSTMDGYLSNEVRIEDYRASGMKVTITTKGGFKALPHPVVV